MYAHMLPAPPHALLYVVPGVWVVLIGFLTPTPQTEGGFRFSTWSATFRKLRRVATDPNRPGKF